MKIKILNKTYINNTLSLTKDLMSDVYINVFRLSNQYGISFIETIELDIQQAYKGFDKINIKPYVNGKELPWIESYLKSTKDTFPTNLFYKYMDKYKLIHNIYMLHKHERINLENIKIIDFMDNVYKILDEKEKTRQRVKSLRREYETYLELKNKFKNYEN